MVAPRDSLKYLLHSRCNLSYHHCGETIQFPLGNLNQPFLLTLLFLSYPIGLRASEIQSGQGGVLSFQINGIFVVSPGRSTGPLETKISRPTELMFKGTLINKWEKEMYMHTVVLLRMNCHLQGNDETGNHIKLKKSDSNIFYLILCS